MEVIEKGANNDEKLKQIGENRPRYTRKWRKIEKH